MLPLIKNGAMLSALTLLLSACGSQSEQQTDPTPNESPALFDSVIALTNVEASTCPNGGVQIEMGIDENGNGTLDSDEVDDSRTETICHGVDGANGTVGNNSLIRMVDADVEDCQFGGKTVHIGQDLNNNNTLDDSEITQSESICNVSAPTYTALVNNVEEPAGANCANGGVKIESGLDINANGFLDESEIQDTEYVCNGQDGDDSDLTDLLIEVIPEPWGENCFHGGEKIQIGLDANQSGILDAGEIISASYSCIENDAPDIGWNPEFYDNEDGIYLAIAGESYSVVFESYDALDDTFISITNKPAWMTITPISDSKVEVSGIVPSGDDVNYSIEISATDTDEEESRVFEFKAVSGAKIYATPSVTSIVEGDSGTQIVTFTVTLSQILDYPISLQYDFISSTSMYSLDWLGNLGGSLEFAAGETTQEVEVSIVADTRVEIYEFIRLNLSSLNNDGSEFVKLSGVSEVEVINDDGTELTFRAGEESNTALILNLPGAGTGLLVTPESKPEWLTAGSEWISLAPGFDIIVHGLRAFPDESQIGETGEFVVQVSTDIYSIEPSIQEFTMTYTIVEGDRDNDGVVNSEDVFPDNPRGATDSDVDGIGDEWEMLIFESLDTAYDVSDFDSNGISDRSAFENDTPAHDLNFDFESGALPNGWVNSGDVDWVVTSDAALNGSFSIAPASTLQPGQTAILEFDIEPQLGTAYFYSRLENDSVYVNYDSLQVSINGQIDYLYLWGLTYWEQYSFQLIPGEQHVVITYTNSSASEIYPKVYLDDLIGLTGIIPGDRDGDGSFNNDDVFPDNFRGATDADLDGIGDEWEYSFFFDLTQANASSDYDLDEVLDINEFVNGTDPTTSDTDGDGVSDSLDADPLDPTVH